MDRNQGKSLIFRCLVLVCLAACLGGCGPKRYYAPTPEGEFEAALDTYQKKKLGAAIESFKQIIYKYPGSDLVEQSRFYLADSYFLNGEYLLAANEFERLNREFPQGRFADVSLYKAGLAYDQMSRRVERDQNESIKAQETLETLLAKYPNSKYADSASIYIGTVKNRLARKEYATAQFYFKRGIYDSAIIYLKSVLESYPESSVAPAALYDLYQASVKMGYPDDARDAKAWLCKDFPQSVFGQKLCSESADSKDTAAVADKP